MAPILINRKYCLIKRRELLQQKNEKRFGKMFCALIRRWRSFLTQDFFCLFEGKYLVLGIFSMEMIKNYIGT